MDKNNKIDGKDISMWKASKELIQDTRLHGLQGVFRGQGVGIVKAINYCVVVATMF